MKEIRFGFIAASVSALIVLFLLSSTDLVLKEQVETIYTISVIANDTNEECFANYRGGMEQGMKEWTADINFVSLYEQNNVQQQMDLILREIENGAESVIVFPVDGKVLAVLLEENPVNVPIIFVNAWVESEKVSACIYADNLKTGAGLAELAKGNLKENGGSIYAFADTVENMEAAEYYMGLEQVGSESGVRTCFRTYRDETDLYRQVGEAFMEDNNNILIALTPQTLTLLLHKYKENIPVKKTIYGMGYCNYILYHLEQGNVSGIGMHDNYDMGYMGVKTAVSLLKQENVNRDIQVESYIVRPGQVHQEAYEKILFPLW